MREREQGAGNSSIALFDQPLMKGYAQRVAPKVGEESIH
jgi:hypothetical protein